MAVSEEEVGGWVEAIADLHASTAREPGDMRAAEEAAANLWSGYGYQNAPAEVLRMLVQAIEIGYMAALHDVRDGSFDTDIRAWRPELAHE